MAVGTGLTSVKPSFYRRALPRTPASLGNGEQATVISSPGQAEPGERP
jgi:hypothetical protein